MTIADALRERTFVFATGVVAFCRDVPSDWRAREISRQLLRSATGLAANYRAACRGRSRREFVAKLGVAVEEADETVFWLELMDRTGIRPATDIRELRMEAQELLAILARSHRTARERFAAKE